MVSWQSWRRSSTCPIVARRAVADASRAAAAYRSIAFARPASITALIAPDRLAGYGRFDARRSSPDRGAAPIPLQPSYPSGLADRGTASVAATDADMYIRDDP